MRGRFDLPAIIFRAGQAPVALLTETPDGNGFVTAPQEDGRTSIAKTSLLRSQIVAGVSFS